MSTTADQYLRALRLAGIERLYVNSGTDFPPIIEAVAQNPAGPYPAFMVAAHENLAVGMAHGAHLATGRQQAVMLHTSVGTANAVCAAINAARDRIPLLITAGRSPIHERGAFGSRTSAIHWAQEMYDQAGMLREVVKWDYELRDARHVADVVARAVSIAMTHPRGPVYLSLPREALASATDLVVDQLALTIPAPPAPDPRAIATVAAAIRDARFPVIATAATGADREVPALLAEVSERFAVGVVEHAPRAVNAAPDLPLHLGYSANAVLADADVLCYLDCDVPWIDSTATPMATTTVIQVGPDPLFTTYPMRSHRSDVAISATPALFLRALIDALGVLEPGDLARRDRLAAAAAVARSAVPADASMPGDPVTVPALNAALARLADDNTVIVNEYWASPAVLRRTRPGTYWGMAQSGGLGWALPAALGVKSAEPAARVIATVGDGAYLFANPAACHHASALHGLPVLTIVNNNAQWRAVSSATRQMYPQGAAVSGEGGVVPLASLGVPTDVERYVEASGGAGFVVDRCGELDDVLAEAMATVDGGRQAVVNVRTI